VSTSLVGGEKRCQDPTPFYPRRTTQRSSDRPNPGCKADADYVGQRTGYAIGGVAPLGHAEPLVCLIDEDLFQYDAIWAAAGLGT